MSDPRVTAMADAIQTYWLNGIENEELREWWSTADAAETALDLASALVATLTYRQVGFGHPTRGGGWTVHGSAEDCTHDADSLVAIYVEVSSGE